MLVVANWTCLTNHARVLLCIAHDRGCATARHRGQPGHHRAHRLRHPSPTWPRPATSSSTTTAAATATRSRRAGRCQNPPGWNAPSAKSWPSSPEPTPTRDRPRRAPAGPHGGLAADRAGSVPVDRSTSQKPRSLRREAARTSGLTTARPTSLRFSHPENVAYAASRTPAVMPKWWKRASMPMRRVSSSRSTGVQVAGLRPVRGLRMPARMGAMTRSLRARRAAMVRVAGAGVW
jgi:hypothetical protein